MNGTVLQNYRALVAEGRLEADAAQIAVIESLDALAGRLDGYNPPRRPNAFGWLMGA